MKPLSIRRIAVAAALVLAIGQHPLPAAGAHPGSTHFAATCATPASTDCIVSANYGTANGAGGTNLSTLADVKLDVFTQPAQGYIQVEIRDFPGTGGLADYDVSQSLPTNTELTVVLRFANTFTPAVLIAVAYLPNWTWNALTREMTIIAFPRGSSWSTNPANCGDVAATNDHAAMFLMAIEDTSVSGIPDPVIQAEIQAFLTKFTGGYISTNAQCFGVPYFDPSTNAVKFDLGAPHFKSDGVTLNTGFFRVLIPDPVISDLWGLVPLNLTVANVNVTVAGAAAGVTMTRQSGRAPFPDGWIFENAAPIGFSTPTISISPVAAAFIPTESVAPPRLSDVASTEPATFDVTIHVPDSGAIRAPLTVKGADASIALQQGTSLLTSTNKTFNGYIRPPKAVADPTGGKLISPTSFSVFGGPDPRADVRLSLPATLTVPLPTGLDAAEYQPVKVGAGNALSYLIGRPNGQGVALDVDRLTESGTTVGLIKIPKPAVQSAAPTVVRESGYHARWAGQSDAVDLATGQLTDVTVLLRNTGDRMWTRGDLATQVNLGSANSLAHGLGILVSPLWSTDRFATTAEKYVPVGDVGTFKMRLRAPAIPGVFRVYLRPVIDGVSWLEDEGIYLELRVK